MRCAKALDSSACLEVTASTLVVCPQFQQNAYPGSTVEPHCVQVTPRDLSIGFEGDSFVAVGDSSSKFALKSGDLSRTGNSVSLGMLLPGSPAWAERL